MNNKWYEDALVYHLYTFSAAGAPFLNGYGGTEHRLGELEKWIPHVRGMGFNTVLLSPVFKSRSHGYDVTDYLELDNRLGTNSEFRSLVEKLHANGIRVILDSVFNHCGRDFFAFRELCRGNRDYADWFSGVDFSRDSPLGDPFSYDTWSEYWELPKFNLGNLAARNYLLDAARFWIEEFDIDGMRLDAANVLDFSFMADLRCKTMEWKKDFWLMGEVIAGDYSRWVNDDTLHSVTNYILYKSLFSSHNDNNLYELSYTVQNSIPFNGLPLYNFLDNHDQNRIASNVNNPAFLSTLYTLLFTLPGIPSVYYGSEWGIKGVKEKHSDQGLRPYIDIDKRESYSIPLTTLISKLAHLRPGEKALRHGSYRQVSLGYRQLFVFERSYEDESIFVAVNIQNSHTEANLSAHGAKFRDLLSGELIPSPRRITIEPYSAKLFKRSS